MQGRWRRLRWPALTTAAMLSLTLSLGTWQVRRLAWKTEILAEIDRGEQAAPVPLPLRPNPFQRVQVDGEYLPGAARYGAEVRTGRAGAAMGAHVLALLRPDQGSPILVDRGWAPIDTEPPAPPGRIRLEGYVRPPEPAGRLAIQDDAAARRYFALDPVRIGQTLGAGEVAPFTLVLMGPPGSVPEPVRVLPRPPNDHLTYAITWFGLSAVLAVVFAVYARQVVQKERA